MKKDIKKIKNTIDLVEKIVKNEFDKADKKVYGFPWYFDNHIKEMVKLSESMARKFKANREIVVLASYLHDIGLINYGPKGHVRRSVYRAKKILKKLELPEEKINKVCRCIYATNPNSKYLKSGGIEEKIVATSDALSRYFKAHMFVKLITEKNFEKYKKWLRKKLKKDRKKIVIEDYIDLFEEKSEIFNRILNL